jgi:hypothetical protein
VPDFRGANQHTNPKYGNAHQKLRRALKPTIDAGDGWCAQPICLMPSRRIAPGARWCLGHNDAGTEWIGPVHELCNQREAAAKGGRTVAAKYGRSHRSSRIRARQLPQW